MRRFISSIGYCCTVTTSLLMIGCTPPPEPIEIQAEEAALGSGTFDALIGGLLFTFEQFDGNGRTCQTCHSLSTGDITLAKIQQTHQYNPNHPLFRPIDSDDGTGSSYNRLLTHGTFLVNINLPANIQLASDPAATSVSLFRGVNPNTNVGLDPVLMWDGREPDLESQALSAAIGHAQIEDTPTQDELRQIAAFQIEAMYSSKALRNFSNGGPAPELPLGNTESEKRGREFFVVNPTFPAPGPGLKGVCALCHTGDMLNEGTPFGLVAPPIVILPGQRFFNTQISAFNKTGLPVRTYNVTKPDGTVAVVASSDPGRMLITGNIADFGRFTSPTLWGIKKTAPYFHDNSAKTLEEVMDHYTILFTPFAGGPPFTAQERADIIAYMKLL
jgi:cytochrome c peroxidase